MSASAIRERGLQRGRNARRRPHRGVRIARTPDGSRLPAFIVSSHRRSADFGHHPDEQRHQPVHNYPCLRLFVGIIVVKIA